MLNNSESSPLIEYVTLSRLSSSVAIYVATIFEFSSTSTVDIGPTFNMGYSSTSAKTIFKSVESVLLFLSVTANEV